MGHKDHDFVAEVALDAIAEDSVGDLRVYSTQWVIEKVYVGI